MQRVHFQVPSRYFQLSKNLGKDSFRYLWYCDKKQIECGLAWHWWNSTDLGLLVMFAESTWMQKLLLVCCHSENRATSQIWKVLPNMGFSPDLGGKNGVVLNMRMQVILDSSFARPGWAPIWGGKKGEFRDWTTLTPDYSSEVFKPK